MRTIDKINQMLDEKGISGPRTILSESGVAARCRRELFENSDKFRVELFPIWKYFDLLRPAKQKAPSASHRAGGKDSKDRVQLSAVQSYYTTKRHKKNPPHRYSSVQMGV